MCGGCVKVEIWADVVCPWCYIGKRRFEAALAQFAHHDDVEVVHRSFQLDPSAPRGVTRPTREVLAEKYRGADLDQMFRRVEGIAAAEGLDYHLARGTSGNTVDALRLLHAAAAAGLGEKAWELFYRAYFTQQRSVFDRDPLVELAVEAGLSSEVAEAVLDSDDYASAVEDDTRTAASLGAAGVPFFVADRRVGVAGAQPVEVMLAMLEQAWQAEHPVQIVASADGETCTDSACL
jgi:predicted DsbA family dithiol-disulfide isomerase